MNYDFTIGVVDTDSISFCKSDMSEFTKEELSGLLKELNDISPEKILWEDDGYFISCVALKAKNYVLWDGKTKKIKGSAFKTSSKEPALREFMEELVDEMLIKNDLNVLINIYIKFVKESQNIVDINRWCAKKTVTNNVMNGTRKNETKIVDAIQNEKTQIGDKVYVFSKIDGEVQKVVKGEPVFYKDGRPNMVPNKVLKLVKEWVPGEEDKDHYLKRVYDTLTILENVLPIESFINYSKASNKELLAELLNERD